MVRDFTCIETSPLLKLSCDAKLIMMSARRGVGS